MGKNYLLINLFLFYFSLSAIDPLNLLKSVECYDSLVLCPLKDAVCFSVLSKSTLSCSTKDNSKRNSPHAESESLKITRIDSTNDSDKSRTSLKESLNHYCNKGFVMNNNVKEDNSSKRQSK